MTKSDELRTACVWKMVWDGCSAQSVADWGKNIPGWPEQSTISGWARYFAQTGRVVLPPLRREAHNVRAALRPEHVDYLLELVSAENDIYLDEYKDRVNARFGIAVSESTVSRALLKHGRTRKVRTSLLPPAGPAAHRTNTAFRPQVIEYHAKQRSLEKQAQFLEDMNGLRLGAGGDAARLRRTLLVFDETHCTRDAYARRHGRSRRGMRALRRSPLVSGKRWNIFAVFTSRGFLAWRIMDRNGTTEEYETFVYECVLPHVRPFPERHSVLLLDNAAIHHGPQVSEWFEELGGHVRLCGVRALTSPCSLPPQPPAPPPQVQKLPPYSPIYSPIELAFGWLKKWIKRHAKDDPLATADPQAFISRGMSELPRSVARGFFGRCGY